MIKFFKRIVEQVIDDFGLTTYTERICFAIGFVTFVAFIIFFGIFIISQF